MLSTSVRRNITRTFFITISVLLILFTVTPIFFRTHADSLPNREVKLSSASPGSTAAYRFAFDFSLPNTVGSIDLLVCANSPITGDVCDVPMGLDATGAVLSEQTGEIGFSVASTTANEIILTRVAANAVPGSSSYTLSNIIDPADAGAYYVRVVTYPTEDATGTTGELGGLVFAIVPDVSISTTIPPFLLLCTGLTISATDCGTASGDYLNFGELSSNVPRSGSSQMVLATNAKYGYSVQINGTTMLSGNNVIPPLNANDVSRPGTGQFGVNLRNNTDPNIGADPAGSGTGSVSASYGVPNRYRFVAGEQVASVSHADAYRKYTVSYLVNVSQGQAPGIYVSTITYTATATF